MLYITGTNDYHIDKDLKVYKNGIPQICDDELYPIELYGVKYTVSREWLYLYSLSGIDPSTDYTKFKITDFKFKLISTLYHGVKILKTRVYLENPIELNINNIIFRVIPSFPKYAISKDGMIYDIVRNKFRKISYIHRKYPIIMIMNKRASTIAVHILVALCWVSNSDWGVKTVVNHLDGDKMNFISSNLEWCTSKENSEHAINTKLVTQSYIIMIHNIVTGEITKCMSMTEACRIIGRSRITSTYQNIIGHGKIINNTYELKYEHDKTPWKKLSDITNVKSIKVDRVVICKNVITNKTIKTKYSLLRDMLNCDRNHIYKMINSNGAYIISNWRCKLDNNLPFSKLNEIKNKPVNIVATNNENILKFDSLRKASNFFTVDRKTLMKYITKNKKLKDYTITIS